MPSLMAIKLIIRLVNGDIRHLGPSLCLAVTNFTVLHRYSQLLYIDIFHYIDTHQSFTPVICSHADDHHCWAAH